MIGVHPPRPAPLLPAPPRHAPRHAQPPRHARPPRQASPRPGARGWWVATAVLLVIAVLCLAAGVRGNDDALAGPLPAAADAAGPTPAAARIAARSAPATGPAAALPDPAAARPAPVAAAPPPVARSAPVELRIPAIGLRVPVPALGLNPDRTVQVPTDFQRPGWYRLGPAPGQLGSAVILGHVDSFRGPAVFFRIRDLRAGDDVLVTLADGTVTRFVVTAVAMYPKDRFPAQQVYGSRGISGLQLVTCGGEFDRTARSYLSNVVVYSSLVSTTAAPDR